MRKIIFRGKDIAGNWHEGLLSNPTAGWPKGWFISNKVGRPFAYEVRPESIGQYTGIDDVNGTKIFEGDIVEIDSGVPDELCTEDVFFSDGSWNVEDDRLSNQCEIHAVTVIGNIHDKPSKLLEKK